MAEQVETPEQKIDALIRQVALLVADVAAHKVNFDAHTHTGVTVGAGVTGAPSAPMTASTAVGVAQFYAVAG